MYGLQLNLHSVENASTLAALYSSRPPVFFTLLLSSLGVRVGEHANNAGVSSAKVSASLWFDPTRIKKR